MALARNLCGYAVLPTARKVPCADLKLLPYALPTARSADLPALLPSKEVERSEAPRLLRTYLFFKGSQIYEDGNDLVCMRVSSRLFFVHFGPFLRLPKRMENELIICRQGRARK